LKLYVIIKKNERERMKKVNGVFLFLGISVVIGIMGIGYGFYADLKFASKMNGTEKKEMGI
jgi:hypothetical protein